MTLKNILSKRSLLIATISLLVGIVVGAYSLLLIKKKSSFTVSPTINIEINPFELLSVPITILLTIYVTRILGKKNDQEKIEKDILIGYLLDFKKDLRSKFEDISEKEDIEITRLNSNCKILRKRIYTLVSIAEKHSFIISNDPVSTEINNKVRNIWELLTDTPKNATARASKDIKDGVATIRKERLGQVENEILEIERLIFDLIVKLNLK